MPTTYSGLSYNNYNYNNQNSNVGSRICLTTYNANPANKAKNHLLKRALVPNGKTTKEAKAMKRRGNLYDQVCSIDNLVLADTLAQKGKSKTREVIAHNSNKENDILTIHTMLKNRSYRTSPYSTFQTPDEEVNKKYIQFFLTTKSKFYDCIKHHRR